MIGLVAIAFLIAANAAFVAAEFGLVMVSRSALQRMAEEGDRRAGRVLQSVRNLSFHLSGAQFGITWSSLAVGAIIEPTVGVPLSDLVTHVPFMPQASALEVSIAVALVIATAVQMVVGELIPKNVAIALPMRTAFLFILPLRLHNMLLKPLIGFLNGSANALLRMVGVQPREELSGIRSLTELDLLIQSSLTEREFDVESFRLLRRSIAFGSRIAREVMVPHIEVKGIQKDSSLDALAKLAGETGFSRFPVYVEILDDASNVVHIKAILSVPPARRASTKVAAVMQPALVIPETVRLRPLLARMRKEASHMALVSDEYGSLAGIVTLDDILEQVVGELSDRQAQITTADGDIVVSGDTGLGELEEMGVSLPEGAYDTIAGFILSTLGRFPEAGERIAHESWIFEVAEATPHRITRVRIAPATEGARWPS